MDDKRYQGFSAPDPYRGVEEEEINLADLWRALVGHRELIALITAACAAVALAVALMTTPVYRAETLLSPVGSTDKAVNPLLQLGGLEGLAGISLGGGNSNTAVALATLTSRSFTDAFIKQENVMPVLFADKWDDGRKAWKDGVEEPTTWDAYKLFDRDVRFVSKDVKSGLVTLAIEWHDPALAAQWANRLVARLNAERRAEAIREAETNIAYLKEQLAETSLVEMQQAIHQLIESKIKTIMVAKSLDEYAFKVIDHAVAPQEHIRPRRIPIVILGIALGLIASTFVVLIRARLTGDRAVTRSA